MKSYHSFLRAVKRNHAKIVPLEVADLRKTPPDRSLKANLCASNRRRRPSSLSDAMSQGLLADALRKLINRWGGRRC